MLIFLKKLGNYFGAKVFFVYLQKKNDERANYKNRKTYVFEARIQKCYYG
jgi:hypothetical protein